MSGGDRFFDIQKLRQRKGLGRAAGRSGAVILNGVIREELSEKVIFEQNPEESRDITAEIQEINDGLGSVVMVQMGRSGQILEMFW